MGARASNRLNANYRMMEHLNAHVGLIVRGKEIFPCSIPQRSLGKRCNRWVYDLKLAMDYQ
jgi:hypothetical protein